MRHVQVTLAALLLAGSIVGCGLALGLDEYQPDCEESNCIPCTNPTECGSPTACASWTCETGYCKKAPAAARTDCPDGVCDGKGQCIGCVITEDCPVWEACGSWTCETGRCVLHLDPPGTVPPQMAGDCKATTCGADGQIVAANDDTDAPPTTDCQVEACKDGKPSVQAISQGILCDDEGGKVCNGKGQCVECVDNFHCGTWPNYCDASHCYACNDGIKNGDETDIDCGGDHCGNCEQGKTCNGLWDCQSAFCVDGVCCDEPCGTVCWACNLPSAPGNCSPSPKYAEDANAASGQLCLHSEGKACNSGVCRGAVGTQCADLTECASLQCTDNNNDGKLECVKDVGDPCTMAVECINYICTDGKCG